MSTREKDLMEKFVKLSRVIAHEHWGRRGVAAFGSVHRGQGRVLSMLKLKTEISQKELGYLLDMSKQALGELLAKLEKNGYIARTVSETDRRAVNVRITPEGEKALSETGDESDEIFSCLNEEEQENLSVYLDRITENAGTSWDDIKQNLREHFESIKHRVPDFVRGFDRDVRGDFRGGFDCGDRDVREETAEDCKEG